MPPKTFWFTVCWLAWSSSVLSTGKADASPAWRILAIRVEFPRETPDDPTTTGDGTFDLR
ncbi:MAG: hypothetical protein HY709_10990, partial [Candidatus Latescibacteria bacterium]|nr:hypothetical protein [Candidatus Latescibacterota bacterium]